MQTYPPQEERPKSTCPIQFHSDFGMFAVDQYQLTNCSIIVEAAVSAFGYENNLSVISCGFLLLV